MYIVYFFLLLMALSNLFLYIIQVTNVIGMTLKDMVESTGIKSQHRMQQRANGSRLPTPHLVTWMDFNPSIDEKSHAQ